MVKNITMNNFDLYIHYNAFSRYCFEKSGMYETTGENTQSAWWVSVKILYNNFKTYIY